MKPLTEEFHKVSLHDIKIPEGRQRETLGDVEELADSIDRLGLINPITITRDNILVAGERRVKAYEYLLKSGRIADAHCPIPCQYVEDLGPIERAIVEYEENIKRVNLTWKEDSLAVQKYYKIRQESDPEFSSDDCSKAIGLPRASITKRVAVAEALLRKDPQIMACTTLKAAYNVIERRRARAIDEEVENLFDAVDSIHIDDVDDYFGAEAEDSAMAGFAQEDISEDLPKLWYGTKKKDYRSAAEDITCEDFRTFAKNYDGTRFNFIHCDFPYGIGMDKSDQASHEEHRTYDDSEETFFELLGSFLRHRENLLAEHSHVMFWFSMKYYAQLVEIFRSKDFTVNPFPLVWYKSDKKGILPDPKRGPRRCYETALLLTHGDRKVVKSVSNAIDLRSPQKGEHYTQKPFLVLQHFFRMLVDESTNMLDPTCGSGTALCVAEALYAKSVRGMDVDQRWAQLSVRRLNETRLAQAMPEKEDDEDATD